MMETKASSSRLCIKGLPKTFTDERKLREHFSSRGGEITDLKLLKTREGMSRQMAFIGFRSDKEAEAVMKYFDKTFMGTQRISVEFAFKVGGGSEASHRPWSRHSEGSSSRTREERQAQVLAPPPAPPAPTVKGKGKAVKGLINPTSKDEPLDPKLQEFLNLMAPRSKAKVWANDDLQEKDLGGSVMVKSSKGKDRVQGNGMKKDMTEVEAMVVEGEDEEDDEEEEYQVLPDVSFKTKEKDQEQEEEEEEKEEVMRVVEGKPLSDLEYLKSKVTAKAWDDSEDEDKEAFSDHNDQEEQEEGEQEEEEEEEVEEREKGGVASKALKAEAALTKKEGSAKAKYGLEGGVMVVDGTLQERAAGRARGQEPNGSSEDQEEGKVEEEEEGLVAGDEEEEEAKVVEEDDKDETEARKEPRPPAPHSSSATATGRLFIRNLAYTVNESDLSDLFSPHGDLLEVHLVLDRETKKSKGTAYCLFSTPESAQDAKEALDSTIFQGRLLHILDAEMPRKVKGKDGEGEGEGEEGGKTVGQGFRAEKAAKRQASAGEKVTWNSLFMRPDTIAEAIAALYKVSKAELLDRSASDLPVRMALGEAQVAQQTKKELAALGVDVGKLEEAARAAGKGSGSNSNSNGMARSPNVLLVKNLPFSADADELLELFSGQTNPAQPSASSRPLVSISRLVLPDTKALALVEFSEPQDARFAFKSLAYKKYHHVPLYLEWAPKDIFTLNPPPASTIAGGSAPSTATGINAASRAGTNSKVSKSAAPGAARADVVDAEDAATEGGVSSSYSIYVKNLAFATSDDSLRKHFDRSVSSCGGFIRSAKVAKKAGPDGKMTLSMGFGFVEVDREEIAKAVIKEKQGSMLDGHKLSLQLSRSSATASSDQRDKMKKEQQLKKKRKGDDALVGDEEEGSSKLVVRNVAFEATRNDLVGLFGPFGHLKSCRLPKKFDGNHRGFAFVEYVTQQEAKNAIEGLTGTHLYGRRLVVEQAQEDPQEAGDVEGLRAKTGSQFAKRSKREAAAEAAALKGKGGLSQAFPQQGGRGDDDIE